MKNAIIVVLLVLLAQGLLATDIHSYGGSGYWFNPSTWIGNMVPEPQDNVFIHGVVSTLDVTCNNLTVLNGGQLLNYRSEIPTVTINGNISNAGIITNNDMNYLSIVAKGNIVNTGTISTQYLYLSGAANQYLSSTLTLNPVNLIDTVPSSSVILQSDISLTNTSVNMNYATLVLNGSPVCDLTMSGGYLAYAVIHGGNGSTLSTAGNCYLYQVSMDEIIFNGVVIIHEGVSIGILHNFATVYNYLTTYVTMTITQRLENHGTLRNNPSMNWLGIILQGDLYNNGTISNDYFTMANTATASLYQSPASNPISCLLFYSSAASGDYQLLSDLRFLNCNVNFFENGVCMHSGSESYGITINGGSLHNAVLDGDSSSFLTLGSNARLQSVTADEIIFNGVVIVADNVSIGNLYNNATLYNYQPNVVTLNVTQLLENHGIIRNNPVMNYLSISLGGDLYNYGTISMHAITFGGSTLHHLYQGAFAAPIICANFTDQSGTGNFQMLSDLAFASSNINLGGKTVQMYLDRSSYGLYILGGFLANTTLTTSGFSTIELGANSFLDHVTAEDIILQGNVILAAGCSFDDVVVYGTVYNYGSSNYDALICSGNLLNYGTLRDHLNGNHLYVYCHKDLTNYGNIQCYQVFIDGAVDQYVLNGAGSSISCAGGFNLVSEIGLAQWYFNGMVNNGNFYPFLSVSPFDFGVWQPYNGEIFGRHIVLGNGLPVTIPQNLVMSQSGAELKLQWDEVDNAIYYTVYASADPNGTFLPLAAKVFDGDLTDGIVWMDITPTDALKFYKVSAGN